MKNSANVFTYLICLMLTSVNIVSSCFADELSAKEIMNFRKVYLQRGQENKLKAQVQIVSRARCTFGDLDAINLDLKARGEKSLIQLGAETVGTKASDKDPEEVADVAQPVEASNRGGILQTFELELPYYEQPTVLGLYICTIDSDKPGAKARLCSSKQVLSYDKIFAPYKVNSEQAVQGDGKFSPATVSKDYGSIPPERTYFFRFVIAYRSELIVPTEAMSEIAYYQLSSYLNEIGSNVNSYEELLGKLKHYGETLGSLPLKVDSNKIQIELPYYSTKKCLGT